MKTYGQWAPTGFDSRGAFLPDRQEWLVVPVAQTRDSDQLAQSNFAVALRELEGESETVEVRRFGHWGTGWFEIILVAPESNAARTAEELEASLESYPVLDEADWSEREWTAAADYWARISISERVEWCRRYRCSIFAARRDEVPQCPTGELISALAQ
jgi:hypothetical protein